MRREWPPAAERKVDVGALRRHFEQRHRLFQQHGRMIGRHGSNDKRIFGCKGNKICKKNIYLCRYIFVRCGSERSANRGTCGSAPGSRPGRKPGSGKCAGPWAVLRRKRSDRPTPQNAGSHRTGNSDDCPAPTAGNNKASSANPSSSTTFHFSPFTFHLAPECHRST